MITCFPVTIDRSTTKFYIIALDGLIELAALKAKITKEFENQYNSEMPKVKHVITALKDHAGWYHKNKDQVKRSESLRQLQGFCDEAIKGVLEILIEDAENMSKIYNELKPPKPVIMVPRNGQSSQQLVITER